MNAYVNYLIEANLALMITLLFYQVLLRGETQFNFKRAFLLIGISASLLFPLIKIQTDSNTIPSIGEAMSTYFLPELVIGGEEASAIVESSFSYWMAAKWVYLAVSLLLLIRLVVKLSRILSYLRKTEASLIDGKFEIIESTTDLPTFSFFHYIFIGNTSSFSPEEKDQIIKHEITHSTKLHSLDILLVEFLKIIFWFNPLVYYFKSLFTSIHEFQADQLAVNEQDVNQYCNLLARVALQSADYPIANHFNNSLTLKRIDMMKTAKTKLSRWKIAMIAPLLIGLFVLIACQDQVMNDLQSVVDNSTMAGSMPEDIKTKLEQLQKANPSKGYVVLELNKEGQKTFDKLKAENWSGVYASTSQTFTNNNTNEEGLFFVILEKGEQTQQLANLTKADGEIFTIVDEPASPAGGMPVFYKFVAEKIMYPLEARTKGIQGRVFVEFVINVDGSLSDIKSLKGIGSSCDEEAARVVSLSPTWVPGKQNGITVRQRMVLPITFKLAGLDKNLELGQSKEPTLSEIVVTTYQKNNN